MGLFNIVQLLHNTRVLWMHETNLSTTYDLFTALKDNNKLKVLDITHNGVTNDACGAIMTAMENNISLVELYI